jgi:hypothetical protein
MYWDPNRDFPYDVSDQKYCMNTITARSVLHVFRNHMFVHGITFHGGISLIGKIRRLFIGKDMSGDLIIMPKRSFFPINLMKLLIIWLFLVRNYSFC